MRPLIFAIVTTTLIGIITWVTEDLVHNPLKDMVGLNPIVYQQLEVYKNHRHIKNLVIIFLVLCCAFYYCMETFDGNIKSVKFRTNI